MERPSFSGTRRRLASHKCLDCDVNVIEQGDYGLIRPSIWSDRLKLGWADNLCIACIEKRRGLDMRDFITFPSVEGYNISDALAERYGFTKKAKETNGGAA
jgi:hypothetical protein